MAQDATILVVKTGKALAPVRAQYDDFDLWIAKALGVSKDSLTVASVHSGDPLPDPEAVDGIIVTGSPLMVSARPEWSERSAGWLAQVVEADALPMLGICYGHQLIAHGLGGEVRDNPNGREIGTVETRHDAEAIAGDPLMKDGTYPTHMSHVESVVRPPSDAQILAQTDLEPHAALRFGPRQWGVQYHPEFDGKIMRGYLEARFAIITEEGNDPDQMIKDVVETPASTNMLYRFGELVRNA